MLNRRFFVQMWIFGALALLASDCWAQQQPPAYLIRIPVPIVGNVDERVKRQVEQLLGTARESDKRPVLVLEFLPPTNVDEGATSQFERSYALANYLASDRLDNVRTVAFLPRTVVGHAVLPVLACEEIVVHPDAQLGDAGRGEKIISMTVRGAYREIANRRRTVPEAIALGMLDKQLKVWELDTVTGRRFVLDEDLEEVQEEVAVNELTTLIEAEEPGLLSANTMRNQAQIVQFLSRDRIELSEALEVAVDDLEPDPSGGGEWRAVQARLEGVITEKSAQRIQKIIEDAVRQNKANLVCLMLDSPGGSPISSVQLASFLSSLDNSQVRTIAFVTGEALADAAVVALACDHLVLQNGAVIGGPGAYQPSEEEISDIVVSIQQIAEEKSRHWSLPVAMIDPDRTVHQYRMDGTELVEHFTEEEWNKLPNRERWVQGEQLTGPDEVLSVSAERAEQLGIARFAVDNFNEFKALYHLEGDPELLKPNWAQELIDYLAEPQVASVLLFFGGFALMVELGSPGVGLGGFVSALCFVVFFWSQFLNGTANWLEILLFFSGISFILLEIFVLPGLGVFGIGGAAMVIASLVLASQTFILPQNEYQMEQFPRSLLTLAAVGGGFGIGLVVLTRFMDRAPLLKRMMLEPPNSEELERRESLVNFDHLLKQHGETTTPLVPAGRARFGNELVDVVSDGMAVDPGTPVEVTEVIGNRVVVRPITPEPTPTV